MARRPLADILVELGTLTREEADVSLARAKTNHNGFGEQLLLDGAVNEGALYRALAKQRGVRFATLDAVLAELDRKTFDMVPRAYLSHSRAFPVRMDGEKAVIATADPDVNPDDLMHAMHATEAEVIVIAPSEFQRFWSYLSIGSWSEEANVELSVEEVETLDQSARSRLVKLFEAIIRDAIISRASDVHFERYERQVRLRYRVDGRLHDSRRFQLSVADLRGLVNVIKIKSDLDITEKRLPQGGRIHYTSEGRGYDLRIQTQPALHGEHVIIRILRQDAALRTISDLGFPPDIASRYERLLGSPQGLVLVVGPTGSGKSTTLYAGLQILASDSSRKTITVEDPIEYAIPNIQQSQVRSEIGFSFADAMRAYVREDPDVILVGEIRDDETALEAIRASQTGHMVLSTLHSNDTVDAVQRLFDLGLHPNSLASELIAVFAQRLVRRICPECKEEAKPDREILSELFPDGVPGTFTSYRGKGCEHCNGRGTFGRIAAVELLRVGAELRRGIARNLPVDDLRALAYEAGLKPIRNHLIELVLQGVVPLEEVPRTLSVEQMAPHPILRDRLHDEPKR